MKRYADLSPVELQEWVLRIKEAPLFRDVTKSALRDIAPYMELIFYNKNELVFQEGEPSNKFLFKLMETPNYFWMAQNHLPYSSQEIQENILAK